MLAIVAILLCAPSVADAFCGFYVTGSDQQLTHDATQVVLMRKGTRTVLSMQNNYKGPPEAFAMVIPVPAVLKEQDVKTLPKAVFENVERMGAPRLVEYWEQDPCTAGAEVRPRPMATGAAPPMPRKAAKAERPRRHRRGAVHRRRVPDRDPVGEGLDRPRHLAAPREVQHPEGRRAAAPPVRRERHEVLRREGRRQEGEVRRRSRRPLAAALPLRHRSVRAADPPRPREQRGHAGL